MAMPVRLALHPHETVAEVESAPAWQGSGSPARLRERGKGFGHSRRCVRSLTARDQQRAGARRPWRHGTPLKPPLCSSGQWKKVVGHEARVGRSRTRGCRSGSAPDREPQACFVRNRRPAIAERSQAGGLHSAARSNSAYQFVHRITRTLGSYWPESAAEAGTGPALGDQRFEAGLTLGHQASRALGPHRLIERNKSRPLTRNSPHSAGGGGGQQRGERSIEGIDAQGIGLATGNPRSGSFTACQAGGPAGHALASTKAGKRGRASANGSHRDLFHNRIVKNTLTFEATEGTAPIKWLPRGDAAARSVSAAGRFGACDPASAGIRA